MQAKVETEEKRKAREKDRQTRTQTNKRARKNNMKKDKRDDVQKDTKKNTESWSKTAEQRKPKEQYPKNVQQSVAAEDAPETEDVGGVQEQQMQPIIPSPIARPTPRSKSAASCSPPTFQDLVRRQIVELPVSLSSSQPLRADKYDFTFDPRLHEEQASNEKALASLSTGTSSEVDDFRLKEKLYKVK
ncbi:hypothetical protein TELCIR_11072 [Teladorsagia circumcincta]|uniref:Uncharacterized protein n=1 Tax=Teladorsagia circumcincta TaxID=45464 RepID=A0A2G9UAC6_TELCI|nr:hypothetical protein TELCIR_11072 [Teladorsagia circumcincta]